MDLAQLLDPLAKFLTDLVGNHGRGFVFGVLGFLVIWKWGWPWQWIKRKKVTEGDD